MNDKMLLQIICIIAVVWIVTLAVIAGFDGYIIMSGLGAVLTIGGYVSGYFKGIKIEVKK